MGCTKIIVIDGETETYKNVFVRLEEKFKNLISHIFQKDSLDDIYLHKNITYMLKDAENRHAQLPHADSIGDDIRMLVFTR